MINEKQYYKFHAWMKLFNDHPDKDYIGRTIHNDSFTYRVFLPIVDKEFVETDGSYVSAYSNLIEKCCAEIDEFVLKNDKYKQMLFEEVNEMNEQGKRIKERINNLIKHSESNNNDILEHSLDINPLHSENNFVDDLNAVIESEDSTLFLEITDKGEFSDKNEEGSLAAVAKQRLFARMIIHNQNLDCFVRNGSVVAIGALSKPYQSVNFVDDTFNINHGYN